MSEQDRVNILTLFYIGMHMFVLYMFGQDMSYVYVCSYIHNSNAD
jgi:hypothetical protein